MRTIFSIAVLSLLASCSTNQDLVQLEEYDDLYYTPVSREFASDAYSENGFLGANSAESSYYGESPYVDESEKPSSDFNAKANVDLDQDSADYYDPDYAARIENFDEDNNPNYVYSDAFANNMNPRFSGNMGMNSFNGFNSFGFGMGIGNPWMGNRWCDPYFDPFCNCNQWGRPGFGMNMGWGSPYGMYDPFSPWYNPYMAYNPYAWGNPYGYNPYGGGVIVVDGGGSTRGFQNTPRNSSSRNSRGGAVGTTSGRRGVATQGDDGPKSNNTATTRGQRASSTNVSTSRTRPVTSATDTDYYNRANSRQYSQADGINPSSRSRAVNDNSRTTSQRQNQVTSPYTRQRERQTSTQQTTDYSRYHRSASSNRSSTRSGNRNSYSSPTRTTRTSPSTTPSTRSRSSFSSPRTSSPSRSTGGGGGSRRR